jgi:hypothetical protein
MPQAIVLPLQGALVLDMFSSHTPIQGKQFRLH